MKEGINYSIWQHKSGSIFAECLMCHQMHTWGSVIEKGKCSTCDEMVKAGIVASENTKHQEEIEASLRGEDNISCEHEALPYGKKHNEKKQQDNNDSRRRNTSSKRTSNNMWTGLGINYNYDGVPYNPAVDLPYLKSLGFTRIRLLIENWDYSAGVANWKTICQLGINDRVCRD